MKVYPLQLRTTLAFDRNIPVDEIKAVFKTLRGAMEFVEKRTGKKLTWEFHGSHGPVWCATDTFHINNGPEIRNDYGITEHELEG